MLLLLLLEPSFVNRDTAKGEGAGRGVENPTRQRRTELHPADSGAQGPNGAAETELTSCPPRQPLRLRALDRRTHMRSATGARKDPAA
ncbi:hypothetical protein GN956_G16835 [Arapaima gigas]